MSPNRMNLEDLPYPLILLKASIEPAKQFSIRSEFFQQLNEGSNKNWKFQNVLENC